MNNHKQTDTIIAIATAMSDAGIGIIRLSGPLSLECVSSCVTDAKHQYTLLNKKANTINLGYVMDENHEIVDEALISYMKAPFSYTGEDIVEINVHGGRFILNKVLKTLLIQNQNKLRTAEPGEFTKRAFLNGKMDLSQAEAVQDLIFAENDFAAHNAMMQLRGDLKEMVFQLREKILLETAYLEAALDDPESYDLNQYEVRVKPVIEETLNSLTKLLETADEGRILKDGIGACIVGRPNVGKSTLLNLLSGSDVAIVTNIPGTTRDVLSESVRIGEFILNLSDTAGIRDTTDAVEQIGVERALKQAKNADLILAVLDQKEVFSFMEETETNVTVEQFFSYFFTEELMTIMKEKKTVLLLNKADLMTDKQQTAIISFLERLIKMHQASTFIKILPVSFLNASLKNDSMEAFKKTLENLFLKEVSLQGSEFLLTNIRHIQAFSKAKQSLQLALNTIESGAGEDLLSVDLMDAYAALSLVVGEQVEDDLADKIFKEFCMGK